MKIHETKWNYGPNVMLKCL